jgi:hypothetical protein
MITLSGPSMAEVAAAVLPWLFPFIAGTRFSAASASALASRLAGRAPSCSWCRCRLQVMATTPPATPAAPSPMMDATTVWPASAKAAMAPPAQQSLCLENVSYHPQQ